MCIYVGNDVRRFEFLNVGENERGVEQIWCGINKDDDKVLVGCIYKPTDSDPRFLRELLESIKKAKKKVDLGEFKSLIVCGDFNLPKVNWPETGCCVNYKRKEEEDFLNGCDDYFMTQVISHSTFGPCGIGGNTFDLVLTSDLVCICIPKTMERVRAT